jgi:uncharacterized protein (TIGR03435 family)
MILPADAPQGRYDLMFTLPKHPMEKLQGAITRTTGFAARKETRETDVLLLKIKDPGLLALHASKRGSKTHYKHDEGMIGWSNFPLSFIVGFLEGAYHKPILVQPGLSGNYDITFQWEDVNRREQAVSEELAQAGLELVPTNMPIEMLVVEKAP